MDDDPDQEDVEVDATRVISLEFSRDWPRYSVEWSVRFRSGDKNYPIGGGRMEALPERDKPAAEVWEELRASAMSAAKVAVDAGKGSETESRPSLRRRLFGGSRG